MTEKPSDIVGHKTFSDDGLTFRHEPLTRAEAGVLMEAVDRATAKRAADMPDEQSAIQALFEAWYRLKELGWTEGQYCPKDGTKFRSIQLGSTGIFDCICDGKWPKCTWTTFDERDAYPSAHPPALIRLYPEDEDGATERRKAGQPGDILVWKRKKPPAIGGGTFGGG